MMDTTADLPAGYLKKYDIELVPVYVTVDDRSYKDQFEITYEEVYTALRNGNHKLTTSGSSPIDFYEAISRNLDKYDAIFVTTISSKLSSTFQSAQIAVKRIKSEKIYLFDSLGGSGSLGLVGLCVAKLAKKGKTMPEILSVVEKLRKRIIVRGYVDDLTNLQKSGRISKLKYYIAKLTNSKPILALIDGEITGITRAGGKEKAIEKLIHLLQEQLNQEDMYDIFITHAEDKGTAEYILEELSKNSNFEEKIIGYFTPGLALHLGLGTIVVTIAPSASIFE
ncbi:MAG: DegV family protein [Candidatus Heimdallarchaeaceae archaeon]